jgi:hypothetical protein
VFISLRGSDFGRGLFAYSGFSTAVKPEAKGIEIAPKV